MNEIFRNRLLAEYSRAELEEEFIRSCECLDEKAEEIIRLEKQETYLAGRLDRLKKDIEDQSKQQVIFDGKEAPIAFRQSQLTVKELQDQIIELERDLGQRQMKRDEVLRQVRYFRSLLNFPGKRAKGSGNRSKQPTRSRAELSRMLSVLLTYKQPPQMKLRIKAAINILNKNVNEAIGPLRELMEEVGESIPLFDALDRKAQIKEREEKIEELRQKLAALRQRHEEMTHKHQELLQQYKDEAEQNNQQFKEVMELQHEKEAKEAEAAKLSELEIIADGLRNEIRLLEDQKVKLKNDNDARMKRMKEQMTDSLQRLQAELRDLEEHCKALRASNADLDTKRKDLEAQYEEAKRRRSEIEELSQQLQTEFLSLTQYYSKMLSAIDDDPFENPQFMEFLNQMTNKDWKYDTIQTYQESIHTLSERKKQIEEKIAKYEQIQNKLLDLINSKRAIISELEGQLHTLQLELGVAAADAPRNRQEYVEGAPHIVVEMREQVQLAEYETAITILFTDFNFDQDVFQNQRCMIALVVDFFDHASQMTQPVSPADGLFNKSILFKTKNDFQLLEYIKTSSIKVTLVKARGLHHDMVAEGNIDLSIFLNSLQSFTSSIEMKSEDSRVVGHISFEAEIARPLNQ